MHSIDGKAREMWREVVKVLKVTGLLVKVCNM